MFGRGPIPRLACEQGSLRANGRGAGSFNLQYCDLHPLFTTNNSPMS